MPVDLILASGTPASFAARDATSTIPIVMGSVAADPVETGLIESLAHPGGNITGMTSISATLTAKRLQILKETVPGLARVAVFWNPPNPTYGPVLKELEDAARPLGLELLRQEVRAPEDFDGAFEDMVVQQAGALIAPADPLTTNWPKMVADLAPKYHLPMLMERRELVEAGGLGANLADLYRRSAAHVYKIFKGAKPGELPMEQPTEFDVAINLKTARALGLTIPPRSCCKRPRSSNRSALDDGSSVSWQSNPSSHG